MARLSEPDDERRVVGVPGAGAEVVEQGGGDGAIEAVEGGVCGWAGEDLEGLAEGQGGEGVDCAGCIAVSRWSNFPEKKGEGEKREDEATAYGQTYLA